MKNKTLKLLYLSTLLLAPQAATHAAAATVCELGRISYLAHAAGGSSLIHISTTPGASTANSLKRLTPDKKYASEMWYVDSSTRWNDRLSLLKMAYALQSPVLITSSDSNCMGPIDEFRITLIN